MFSRLFGKKGATEAERGGQSRSSGSARARRRGICLKCGAIKSGSLVDCPRCGFQPVNDHDLALSFGLNEHQLGDRFVGLSKTIENGAYPQLSPADMKQCLQVVPEVRRMLPLNEDQLLLQDNLETMICSAARTAVEHAADALDTLHSNQLILRNTINIPFFLYFYFFCFATAVKNIIRQNEIVPRIHESYLEKAYPYRVTFIIINSGYQTLFFGGDIERIAQECPAFYVKTQQTLFPLLSQALYIPDEFEFDFIVSEVCFSANRESLSVYQANMPGYFAQTFKRIQVEAISHATPA